MPPADASEAPRPTASQALVAALFDLASRALALVPRSLTIPAGRALGKASSFLLASRRRAALDNLAAAWPDRSEAERRRIARGAFGTAGAMAADLASLARVARDPMAHGEVDEESLDVLRQAKARGRGVILVAGHFGLFESMGILLGHVGCPVAFVAKPFPNPALDAVIARLRGATGNTTIHKGGARPELIERLRAGGVIAIVLDQHASRRGRIWVPFLGLPTATTRSLGSLAVESGAAVVPIHSFPLDRGRFRCEFGPLLLPPEGLEPEAAGEAVVTAATRELEKAIVREPSAWLWLHRRWKVCRDADRARFPAYTITEAEEEARAARR